MGIGMVVFGLLLVPYSLGAVVILVIDHMRQHGQSFLKALLLEEAVPQELPLEYRRRVEESCKRFRQAPAVPEPRYFYLPGAGVGHAEYFPPSTKLAHAVIFTEALLERYGNREFDAIHAHELAHAEWIYPRNETGDPRPHYLADVRAAELVGKEAVITALQKLLREREGDFPAIVHLLYPWLSNLRKVRADYSERVQKVSEADVS